MIMLNVALGFLGLWLVAAGIFHLLPERLTERFGCPIKAGYAKQAVAAGCLAIAAGICIYLIHKPSEPNPSLVTIGIILPVLWAITTFTYAQRTKLMLAEAIVLLIVAVIIAIGYIQYIQALP